MQKTATPPRAALGASGATKRHYGILLVAAVAIVAPRLMMAGAWFWQNWVERAFGSDWSWPLAGIIAFPWTCLAYLWSTIPNPAASGAETLLMVVGLMLDILSLSVVKAGFSRV